MTHDSQVFIRPIIAADRITPISTRLHVHVDLGLGFRLLPKHEREHILERALARALETAKEVAA